MTDNTRTLSLPGVVQRFEESTATLDELSARLRVLAAHETARADAVKTLQSTAEQLGKASADLGAASHGVAELTVELSAAAAVAKRQLEEISPDTVMKAIVHQGARIDQVEKQLAALATSLVTLATGLNQHFVESEERSARATAELDALIDRVLELPAKTRRKHGLEFPDSIRERRRAGEFNVIDRRTP